MDISIEIPKLVDFKFGKKESLFEKPVLLVQARWVFPFYVSQNEVVDSDASASFSTKFMFDLQ